MLIAQNIPRIRGDAFDAISCLTAVTLEGKVLWPIGHPDPRNGLLTNDTPFQIHDIDGDGRNEVVLVRDFKLQILDGATGKVKRWAWMPKAPAAKERGYELVSGDSLVFSISPAKLIHRRDAETAEKQPQRLPIRFRPFSLLLGGLGSRR
jgi:rhamnogalacturonan endolyase